mmetsp:Transcript_30188/g.46218  ORF Transcript_30188/g.46218 Transcript_30188/m.46218 type:complete len:213 (-) Transcript_30188:152-790(-)
MSIYKYLFMLTVFIAPVASQYNNYQPFPNHYQNPFPNQFQNPFPNQFQNQFPNPFPNQFSNPFPFPTGFNYPPCSNKCGDPCEGCRGGKCETKQNIQISTSLGSGGFCTQCPALVRCISPCPVPRCPVPECPACDPGSACVEVDTTFTDRSGRTCPGCPTAVCMSNCPDLSACRDPCIDCDYYGGECITDIPFNEKTECDDCPILVNCLVRR